MSVQFGIGAKTTPNIAEKARRYDDVANTLDQRATEYEAKVGEANGHEDVYRLTKIMRDLATLTRSFGSKSASITSQSHASVPTR